MISFISFLKNHRFVMISTLAVFGLVAAILLYSGSIDSSNRIDDELGPYSFPIRPGMEGWAKFNNADEMYEAIQIPENILKKMPTRSLLVTCLDFPMTMDILASDSFQQGFEGLRNNFNGLRELMSRRDIGSELLAKYQEMDPEEIVREEGNWTVEQHGDYYAKFLIAEMLLAQEEVINKMSAEDKRKILAELVKKFDLKVLYPYYYGRLGLVPELMAMNKILETEGLGLPVDFESGINNDEVIEEVLSGARKI